MAKKSSPNVSRSAVNLFTIRHILFSIINIFWQKLCRGGDHLENLGISTSDAKTTIP